MRSRCHEFGKEQALKASLVWIYRLQKKQTLLSACRVVICRDRPDRRSCKICASCVNFPGKQRNFLHNLRRTTGFTPAKCNFALKLLNFYTLSQILKKKLTQITDINAYTLFLFE